MIIPSFRDWRIRAKLITITLLLVLLPAFWVAYLSVNRFGKAMRNAAEEDLEHLVKNIYAMCNVQQQTGLMKAKSISILRNEIKAIQVAETGYAYVINSEGKLVVHPAKEGRNIIDSEDSSGFAYIRSMIEDALTLAPGEIGTIRYPWINPELGEEKPRQKISKYIHFKPWDWIIAAGTYEEEIYRALYETEQFIIMILFGSLCAAVILTVAFSRVFTKPIQELTRISAGMAAGDLSQRVKVHSADEIGDLGKSYNRMIAQIQDYTANLENMVQSRTQELSDSRTRYRDISSFLNSILESATEYAIMALDFYGTIMEFNKGAEKIFGWKKDEVLHKENIAITITGEDRDKEIQKIMSKRTRAEGVCELEMNRVRKNGAVFPAYTTVTAIKDSAGKTTGFVEILRDFTRRKALESELRETKEFLENVMESSVDGILTTDLKGIITYQNRAMEEMLQYPRAEVLGSHVSRFYVRGIQEAREVMKLLRAAERVENYEMEVRRKDGLSLAILTSVFLLRDGEGRIIGTAGIFKDVTEKKALEAKLKAAQARMVEASKMRALGELVAGVAHELNNPLMASQSVLYVIQRNLPADSAERKRLELIRECNDRIQKIVEHLREFSRDTKADFELLDINRPIESALMITEQQLLNHNISVIKKLGNDLPPIKGNSNQLEQVFLNLISNARDAMDESRESKELTISSYVATEEGKRVVVVAVSDTGVGIPEENLAKVVEPFFSTKPVGKGTGLGLSLCFGIVEAHGGRLEIRSRRNKGTEVEVILPAGDSEKE